MKTLGEAVAHAAHRLRAADVHAAWREARLLVELAAGTGPGAVSGYPERPLEVESQQRLEGFLARRCAGEPVSRIVGVREFWSLPFTLSADTLDPRPDSETVVEAVLDAAGDRSRPLRMLDLGAGTGCLLLAILSELPHAFGIGVDISDGACRTARCNAARLGLAERAAFVAADWGRPLRGGFDVIVANPPYIPDPLIDTLAPEVVRFDPRRALSGGSDGLDAYRRLIPQLQALAKAGGIVALEIGEGQGAVVSSMLEDSGFSRPRMRRDLAGWERCILAEKGRKS